jgi:ribosomal protein S18 acetylase RimI-like enzyme
VPQIRLAEPGESAAIGALIDSAYQHYIPIIGRTPRPMLDDHAARIARGETFVAEADGNLLAVITMAPQPEALHIFNIAVSPDAQGRGLLKQLLAFAESEARRHGLDRLTLFTHELMTRNREIYAHIGFEVLGTQDGGGYSIIHMQRLVPPASIDS